MSMITEMWAAVRAGESHLEKMRENRRRAIAAGLPDPMPGQPLDCNAFYMCSLKNHTAATIGGGISLMNLPLAARRMVGENMTPSHRLATEAEIRTFKEQMAERAAASKIADDKLQGRRSVSVSVEPPLPRSA